MKFAVVFLLLSFTGHQIFLLILRKHCTLSFLSDLQANADFAPKSSSFGQPSPTSDSPATNFENCESPEYHSVYDDAQVDIKPILPLFPTSQSPSSTKIPPLPQGPDTRSIASGSDPASSISNFEDHAENTRNIMCSSPRYMDTQSSKIPPLPSFSGNISSNSSVKLEKSPSLNKSREMDELSDSGSVHITETRNLKLVDGELSKDIRSQNTLPEANKVINDNPNEVQTLTSHNIIDRPQ